LQSREVLAIKVEQKTGKAGELKTGSILFQSNITQEVSSRKQAVWHLYGDLLNACSSIPPVTSVLHRFLSSTILSGEVKAALFLALNELL
jgi:hypothetical protein